MRLEDVDSILGHFCSDLRAFCILDIICSRDVLFLYLRSSDSSDWGGGWANKNGNHEMNVEHQG